MKKKYSGEQRGYAIGRGKPPIEYQFKKGQSGNLRGRPRAGADFAEEVERQFDTRVTIEQKGRRRSVALRVQAIRSLIQRCLKGEVAALRCYVRLMQKIEPRRKRKRPLIITVLKEDEAPDSTPASSAPGQTTK
jgi:hypothetical protein